MSTGATHPHDRPTLPRKARVRARAEFDRVFKQGKRTASPILALHWMPDDTPARLGLAVSRKVDAHAVGRNRIKRAWRECFRMARATLPPGAYVVVARNAAAQTPSAQLRQALTDALRRAGALPPTDATGTMPAASPFPSTASRDSGA